MEIVNNETNTSKPKYGGNDYSILPKEGKTNEYEYGYLLLDHL